jgi:hypothetical protein
MKDPKVNEAVALQHLVELTHNKKQLMKLNLWTGFWRGVGGVIGVAVVLIILSVALRYLGGVPWIGDFVEQINHAAQSK